MEIKVISLQYTPVNTFADSHGLAMVIEEIAPGCYVAHFDGLPYIPDTVDSLKHAAFKKYVTAISNTYLDLPGGRVLVPVLTIPQNIYMFL